MAGTVQVLPFDRTLGYPQRQRMTIGGTTYDLYYRRNSQAGYITLEVERTSDQTPLWTGKLCSNTPVEVRDPTTWVVLMTLLPREIDDEQATVWLFPEDP